MQRLRPRTIIRMGASGFTLQHFRAGDGKDITLDMSRAKDGRSWKTVVTQDPLTGEVVKNRTRENDDIGPVAKLICQEHGIKARRRKKPVEAQPPRHAAKHRPRKRPDLPAEVPHLVLGPVASAAILGPHLGPAMVMG